MGASIAQVSQSTQPQGKGGFQQPQGDTGAINKVAQQFTGQLGGSGKGMAASTGNQASGPTQPQLSSNLSNAMQQGPEIDPGWVMQGGPGTGFQSQSGQPKFGQPNNYPNTVGQWDNASIQPQKSQQWTNASIQPQQSQSSGGKGKG